MTTHDEPVYEKHGVLHYAVANIPGAVARTSTIALTNVTLPYIEALAGKGFAQAISEDEGLRQGVTTYQGYLTPNHSYLSQLDVTYKTPDLMSHFLPPHEVSF
ncbi:hypothetical protein AKJ00_00780, partial [Streptococcus pneumoniae]